jgi:putative ABC transport system substrate-binding protein
MKNILSILLIVAVAVVGTIADAQQSAKIPRVGFVTGGGDVNNPGPTFETFRQVLRDRGYSEGKNIAVEYRSAEGKGAAYEAQLAEELVRLKVDVIVATAFPTIRAAMQATKTIPIVIITSADPVATGLIDSLARPGGNVTGVTRLTRELSGKRLELLKEVVPTLSRVGILMAADATTAASDYKRYEAEARGLKLQLQSLTVRPPTPDFPSAFNAAAKARLGAMIAMSYGLLNRHSKGIADLAIKNRLPLMFERSEYVEAGGLVSYTADEAESFSRAAVLVDKILKGTKPADLPVEQPMRFEFLINLKTAKQIGLTIEPNVLVRAQRVIR